VKGEEVDLLPQEAPRNDGLGLGPSKGFEFRL
jgi:hypothetical protein